MKLAITAAACALCVAGSAHAVTYTYGTLLSGSGAPASATFATLTANVVGNDVQFTLDAFGLDLFAGSTPFVSMVAIGGSNASTSLGGASGGVSVSLASGGGPGGSFDFRFRLGGGQDRLVDNEQVSWTWLGGAGKYTDIALHVQGINYGSTTSAWYVANPVPEPQTYALMAAGLAVVGGLARRRRAV